MIRNNKSRSILLTAGILLLLQVNTVLAATQTQDFTFIFHRVIQTCTVPASKAVKLDTVAVKGGEYLTLLTEKQFSIDLQGCTVDVDNMAFGNVTFSVVPTNSASGANVNYFPNQGTAKNVMLSVLADSKVLDPKGNSSITKVPEADGSLSLPLTVRLYKTDALGSFTAGTVLFTFTLNIVYS